MENIVRARAEIEAMRMMVLRAAKAIDTLRSAIQIHGATGVSQWTPLAAGLEVPLEPTSYAPPGLAAAHAKDNDFLLAGP